MKNFEKITSRILLCVQRILEWSQKAPALSRWWIGIGLILCCLVAIGLRGLRLYAEPVLSVDGAQYVIKAIDFQTGRANPRELGFSPHNFYSAYLASGLLNLPPHQLGLVTNLVLGSLLPLLFFGIAQTLFKNGEMALCCAILAAVHPKLLAYSIEVQREIPYLFFCGMFFLFMALLWRFRKWYWTVFMAFSATLSFLCRYEGLELFLLAFIFFTIGWMREKRTRHKIALNFGVFALSTIMIWGVFLVLLNISLARVWQSIVEQLPSLQ